MQTLIKNDEQAVKKLIVNWFEYLKKDYVSHRFKKFESTKKRQAYKKGRFILKPADAKKYILFYDSERKIIDKKLEFALRGRTPSSLYEPATYILESSGKRLRPLLVLLSAKAVGGNYKKFYNAALAVEMLHNFTLVHDDIMDNADLRRGNLTLHKKYNLNTAILNR